MNMTIKPISVVMGIGMAWVAMAEDVKMPNTFMIGNSLTDHFTADKRNYNPNGPAVDRICEAAGLPGWPIAAKNIAGSPLWWHWYHLDAGWRKMNGPDDLAANTWDIMTFQPHGGNKLHYSSGKEENTKGGALIPADAPRGDVDMIVNFLELALKNPANADAQVYVYSTWVKLGKKNVTPDRLNYREQWLARSDEPVMYTQQYFEALQDELNGLRELGKSLEKLRKPVLLLPAGDVFLALDDKIKSGEMPDIDTRTPREFGISDAWIKIGEDPMADLSRSIHLSPLGQTILSYVFYSTLLARDCHGLDMRSLMHEPTETEFDLTDEQLKIVWDTVWDVVKNHPRSGVKERPAP